VRAGPLPPVDPASQLLSGGALIPAQSASRLGQHDSGEVR
jgi:hypothetical protein